jgi:Subtilase family/Caspase domain
MPKGYSLHIGLNAIDPDHYPGVPLLKAAVNDAVFWEAFAKRAGYTTSALHDAQATSGAVTKLLEEYAGIAIPGDILLLTYAGHGGQIPNDKPGGFDDERNDQTWCLYNRQLLDDELYECFEKFKEGVRILVVSDSCHSATVTRALDKDLTALLSAGMGNAAISRGFASRKLSKEAEQMIEVLSGDSVYKPIQKKYKNKRQAAGVKASVKLLAACQDDEETLDGTDNGIFTEAFISILGDDTFKDATAEELITEVRNRYFFPRPNFFQYGGIIKSFDKAFPFLIDIPDAAKVSGYRKPDLTPQIGSRQIPPIEKQWDTLKNKKPAVLIIEIDNGAADQWVGGKEVTIIEKKKRGAKDILTIELPQVMNEHSWSVAHALQTELDRSGITATVEPVLSVMPAQNEQASREGDINNPEYIKDWPPAAQDKVGIGWHLDEAHSQLFKASQLAKARGGQVCIGHFDTGYIAGHIALPEHLATAKAHSVISKEDPNQAIDKTDSGQDGHGLGTMVLLAGNAVPKSATFDEYEGYIGGAPFAEVIPVRVSESVVILNTNNFCDAIDYAIEQECEVISMSMAGKPSRRMAAAVNRAYEAGIVMVTAASNCWYKGLGALLPKCVMFPAAFERVIAATGAMYDHKPYDKDFLLSRTRAKIGTEYMQGSWGPPSRMKKALAAYTPNTPWASTHHAFLRSGGGTSSATPQVAAAAAVWIAYHKEDLVKKGYYTEGNQWKKVEAVRHALYTSAAKEKVFDEWEKYYGNGIVRALDALDIGVAAESALQKAPEAESSLGGIFELVGSFFKNRKLFRSGGIKPAPEALAAELMHLLQTDPQFYELFSTLDLGDAAAVEAVVKNNEFKQKVLQSPYASDYLKETMVS